MEVFKSTLSRNLIQYLASHSSNPRAKLKQFSNGCDVFYSRDNTPWMGGTEPHKQWNALPRGLGASPNFIVLEEATEKTGCDRIGAGISL